MSDDLYVPLDWAHVLEVVPSVVGSGQIRCRTFRGLCSCLAHSEEVLTSEDAGRWGEDHLKNLT